jgi:hypothetical protein
MKRITWPFIFILIGSCLFSEKLAVLPGVLNPESIAVAGDQLYISDQSTVLLYSLKDLKFIKRIGRDGRGPGEFNHSPLLSVFPDYLVANCVGRVLFFSLNGDYLREKKTALIFFVYPVDKNFVGITVTQDPTTKKTFHVISLYNDKMQHLKDIRRKQSGRSKSKPSGKREERAFLDFFKHRVYGDKIFVGDSSRGFFIEVFDSAGNSLYIINPDYERVKITEKDKRDFINRFKNSQNPFDKMISSRTRFKFDEFHHAFYNFLVDNDKIYVFTHKKKDNKKEIIVLDLKGNIIKKSYLSWKWTRFYTVCNDTLYYLIENDRTEEWELYDAKI